MSERKSDLRLIIVGVFLLLTRSAFGVGEVCVCEVGRRLQREEVSQAVVDEEKRMIGGRKQLSALLNFS